LFEGKMKKIPLTQGKFAIVDDEDFDCLNQWKWQATFDGYNWYAVRAVKYDGKRTSQMMHRQILGLAADDKRQVDHCNRNGLDNRQENIRICNSSQNQHNGKKNKHGLSSQYKGVSWHKQVQKWTAQLVVFGKHLYLGCFNNEVDAAKVYDKAAVEHFGEFARVNFPN